MAMAFALRAGLRSRTVLPALKPAFRPAQLRCFSALKFAKTHEWVLAEDGTGTLGITDFAQNALGEVVFVDLPSEGATVKEKDTLVTLESVKAVGEVYAPVDCEVVAVNEALSETPATVNSSPMKDGWLVKIKFTGDLSSMMDQAAYDEHLKAEAAAES
mmetsp:Transcript_63130/g.150500  ORF Transcript_63130/g.150500 Transcript_63130/m.150500 type:complete len:159 (-) Transcript_63130:96-572(-)|eukprot:CAMPEP_0178419730 /NCGR_PEP_ID=MMETSP0689_2-20121128/25761_1 /TAXON_ID=160604 /ORGANISM="Amphidinium massartii, Strain CS-259" /LENGTH=158 /DNA_ID=CAMNT_0020041177 /DNA_START=45 /DNA_END=521 /DNA_ORIENTATION=-